MWSVKWTPERDALLDKRLPLIPLTMSVILFAFGLADRVWWEVIIGLGAAIICALAPRMIGRFMMGLLGDTVKVEGALMPPGQTTATPARGNGHQDELRQPTPTPELPAPQSGETGETSQRELGAD